MQNDFRALESFSPVPLENVKEKIFDLGVLGSMASVVLLVSNLLVYASLDINLALASRGKLIYTAIFTGESPQRLRSYRGTSEFQRVH